MVRLWHNNQFNTTTCNQFSMAVTKTDRPLYCKKTTITLWYIFVSKHYYPFIYNITWSSINFSNTISTTNEDTSYYKNTEYCIYWTDSINSTMLHTTYQSYRTTLLNLSPKTVVIHCERQTGLHQNLKPPAQVGCVGRECLYIMLEREWHP